MDIRFLLHVTECCDRMLTVTEINTLPLGSLKMKWGGGSCFF